MLVRTHTDRRRPRGYGAFGCDFQRVERSMTLKQFLQGLQSLRVVTPGLVLIATAILLVLMPRRWSAALGGSAAAAAIAMILLLHLGGSPVNVPLPSDLVADQITQGFGLWMALVVPALVASLPRSVNSEYGLAIASVLFSAGNLCVAAAAGSTALFLASWTLSMTGIAAIPFALVDFRDEMHHRAAVRAAGAVLVLWCVLVLGICLLLTAAPSRDLDSLGRGRPETGLELVGAVLVGITVLGLFGAAPLSTWLQGRNPGARRAVQPLLLTMGLVVYLRLSRVFASPELMLVLWAWSMGSLLVHFSAAVRVPNMADSIFHVVGAVASLACGSLFLGEPLESRIGAIAVLTSLTLAVPGVGAALDSCEINTRGDLGRPSGIRSSTLRLSLYLLLGLPLSFGFWGWVSVVTGAGTKGESGGVRQATAVLGVVTLMFLGFSLLRHWSALKARPAVATVEEDRWLVASSLYTSTVLIGLGCWPGPLLSALREMASKALAESSSGP
jgi:hypothetical protein